MLVFVFISRILCNRSEGVGESMSEKKLSRRNFIRMAAVTAAGATLAACAPTAAPQTSGGDQPAAEQPVEKPASTEAGVVQYWYAWGNLDPAMEKALELPEFKEALGNNTYEYKGQVTQEAILTAIAAGTPPDGGSNWDYANIFARGAVTPADNFVATSQVIKKDDILEGLWDSAFFDGKMVGVPGIEGYLWWGLNYNTKAATDLGLDPAAPPTTWDEALEWHKKETVFDSAGNIQTIGLDPYDAMAGECDFAVQSFGGFNWWDENARKVNLNNDAMIESLDVMGEFYRIVGPDRFAGLRQVEGQGGWGASYNAGAQNMIIEGYWHPGETQIQKPEVAQYNKSTWAPVPTARKGKKIMATGAHFVMLFKDAKNQEGMFKVAEFFGTDPFLNILLAEVGWIFGKKSFLKTIDPNTYPGLDFYISAPDQVDEWIIGRRCPIHSFVQTQYQELRELVYRDSMPAKDAAAELQKRAEAEWINQGLS
jgi:hypothetical protein